MTTLYRHEMAENQLLQKVFRGAARFKLGFLAFLFILLICWFGLNYLPSAQYSVHTYTE